MADRVFEADGIQIGLCANCESVHVFLLDESDETRAAAVIPPEQWDEIVKAVQQERAAQSRDAIGPTQGRA